MSFEIHITGPLHKLRFWDSVWHAGVTELNKKWHKWTDDVIKADVQPLVDASHQSCCRLYGQCIHSAEPSHREGLLWAGLLLKRLTQFVMPDGQADGGMCF